LHKVHLREHSRGPLMTLPRSLQLSHARNDREPLGIYITSLVVPIFLALPSAFLCIPSCYAFDPRPFMLPTEHLTTSQETIPREISIKVSRHTSTGMASVSN